MTSIEAVNKIFHSNDNYSVIVNEEGTGYQVVNDHSGVVEFEEASLPECIFAAENLNVVLVHRTYEWVSKRARDRAIQEQGIQVASVTDIQ